MHAKPGADTGGAACRTMIYILVCVSVRDSAWGAGRSGVCHENFGPPKIMVPDQNFWKKLVRADQYYQEILVRVSKNWSGPSIYM